jgi:ABC-2 type transport system ATP-binding protein
MDPLISFQGVHKGFGKVKVIKNLNMDLYEKEIYGFIGKSGAGKTTLLRILIGYHPISSGKIIYKGQDVTKKQHIIRKLVGFCTQENSFYPELTIKENLRYYGRMYDLPGKKLKEQVNHLLELTDLKKSKNSLAKKVSGGMKRRLDFAISLIHDPEILILDEPTTGLDPIIRGNIWKLIEQIRDDGKTIIVTSHLLDFIEKHCDRVGILNHGRLLKAESPNKLSKLYPKAKNFTEVFKAIVKKDN